VTTLSDQVENEVKLSLKIGADLPDLRKVVGASVRQPDESLRAIYFDTPDLRLWDRGITLRYRTGEDTPKWTLKLPRPSLGDALVRTELEWPGDEEQIPKQALDVICGIVRRAPLRKVAELDTERVRFLLENHGVVWAELASDTVTVVGGRKDGQRFRQLELEMASGGSDREDETRAVIKALRRAGARRDPHQKLEKALGPRRKARKLGRKSSTAEVVREALNTGLARLLDHDCRIRSAGKYAEPEDMHQARVATRRLRSDLGTLQQLLDPLWVQHVRGDLRSAGAALGAVRDIDVLTKGLTEAGADGRLQLLREERGSAMEALLEMLRGRRYLDLLDRLHAASEKPPLADRRAAGHKARRVLPRLVTRRWKKLHKDVRESGPRPGDDRLHQIRKRSKQLRYASELAAPVIGKPAKRTAKASESLQTVLGEYHDAVVAGQWLERARNRVDVDAAGGIASLLSQEDQIKIRLGRKWRSRYKRLTKPSGMAWLEGVRFRDRRLPTAGGRAVSVHSFRATSGPVILFRSGNVEAMIASEPASPPTTVAQYAIPGMLNAMPTWEWR
jgi:CHAD domain-containing protein